jgi:hypothetical protein
VIKVILEAPQNNDFYQVLRITGKLKLAARMVMSEYVKVAL